MTRQRGIKCGVKALLLSSDLAIHLPKWTWALVSNPLCAEVVRELYRTRSTSLSDPVSKAPCAEVLREPS